MSKAKNPHGKGKHSLSCTLPNDVLEALDYLATQSGVTRSTYAREAITEVVTAGRIYSAQEIMAKRYNITEAPQITLPKKEQPPGPRIGFHAKKNGNHGAAFHSKQSPRSARS